MIPLVAALALTAGLVHAQDEAPTKEQAPVLVGFRGN
jgi:hypothetical protein